jgi:Dolichyl-phosphate-mannose-protein mannosyltransferase
MTLGWVLAATLLAATAVLAAASLRLPAFTSFLLATYVFALGEIVLLTEALALFDRVGPVGYTVGELSLLVVAFAVWNWRRRPRPILPTIPLRRLREHPALVLLLLAFAVAFGYQAFLVLTTPPNTWDSLAYHLARAAEWYQRGTVDYYPTHSESVNATQPNAEMLTLHGFVFAERDTFAAVPQLLAELACLVAVYGIAIRLGFSRPACAFAALITATLPLVALQSVTTQNDLLTASFVATAIYFALGKPTPELALAGLAIGLALGTKATAVIALPVLLLAMLLVHDRRDVLRGVAFVCVGFALLGAYGYVLNVVHAGRPLGDPSALGPLRQPEPTLTGTASNAVRMGYDFVDLSGYPVPDATTRPLEDAAKHLFAVAHVPVNPPTSTVSHSPFRFAVNRRADETRSFFGPLGVLILLPLSAAFLSAVVLRRAPPLLLIPAVAIPSYMLGVALSTRYNEFNGRYLLPAVVLAMPLAAWVYRRRKLAAAVAGVGVVTLALVHVENEVKPSGADSRSAIWSMSRAEAQSATHNDMRPVLESVERHVPSNARLGYVLKYNFWIYPFYGPELSRQLVKLPDVGILPAAEANDLNAIIVATRLRESAPNWRVIYFPGVEWTLALREPR